MASKGYIATLLNTLPADVRKVLQPCFDHVCDTFQLGSGTKAANLAWYRLEGMTAAVADTEFSMEHGLGTAPSKVIPVLDLGLVNSRLVPLTVTRAPDARRVYLSSPTVSASFVIYVEG